MRTSIRTRFRVTMLMIVAGIVFAAATATAGEASLRNERLQRWADLAGPSTDTPRSASVTPLLPVEGVTAADLHDSFDEPRSKGRRHLAIDIHAPRNTPVVAAVDGQIRKLQLNGAGGLTIYQIDESGSHVYYYAHLQRYRAGVREGTFVHRGEVIGYVGTSGNATKTAPHLHFAIHELTSSTDLWNGTPLDPYRLLTAEGAVAADLAAVNER